MNEPGPNAVYGRDYLYIVSLLTNLPSPTEIMFLPLAPHVQQPKAQSLPFGIQDLDPQVVETAGLHRKVRCYIRGCREFLRVPGRGFRGEICRVHGIRCHASQKNVTYTYADARRNLIVGAREFGERVMGHPFKVETHRFGYEKSEDALTWNTFRSLSEAGALGDFVQWLTGEISQIEPRLYLWGLEVTDDRFEPWRLLIQARERFENHLPVDRPKTEPDIALHLPGRYLILIEAKFTSENTVYERGPRKDAQSLTLAELVGIYQDPRLNILDYRRGEAAQRVHYQLWRNTLFAEWMGTTDHPATRAYHFNLVRDGFETESEAEFGRLVNPAFRNRFKRFTWEQIHRFCQGRREAALLRRYLETKTAGLKRAFNL